MQWMMQAMVERFFLFFRNVSTSGAASVAGIISGFFLGRVTNVLRSAVSLGILERAHGQAVKVYNVIGSTVFMPSF